MEKLLLRSFKAYKELEIKFDNKSFLLYGDNGAGKSSIYDAIRLIFFREKIENAIESSNYAQEVSRADIEDFFRKYNNTNLKDDFDIEINDNNIDIENYQLFMLNLDDTEFEKSLNLLDLIETVYFQTPNNIFERYKEIEVKSNQLLDYFKENIKIKIDNEDSYAIKITDNQRKLLDIKDIKRYFNEAKLNLVTFAILFSVIELFQDKDKKRVLVFDDFITSLDMSNRTFLMKYILDSFEEFQILIFTHNVYFYNLIMYLVNDIYKISNQWKFANLYEINGEHKLSIKKSLGKVSEITERYKNGIKVDTINCPECKNKIKDTYQDIDINEIGNQIRQKFEVLLYEFSKLLMIGGVEDSKKIIERIEKSKSIYFYNKKTASDLLDDLYEVLSLENPQNLQNSLKTKIEKYRQNDFDNLKEIIRSLKLYQKVTLHPMSHGTMGQGSFTKKEINESLALLEKFENYIKDLIDSDVDGA